MLGSAGYMAVIYSRDLAVSRPFYEGTLGLRVVGEDPMGVEFDVAGTRVRLALNTGHQPIAGTVGGWMVEDLDATIAALAQHGIEMQRYEGMKQDEHGVWQPGPGAPRIAWFVDPEGNTLSVRQD